MISAVIIVKNGERYLEKCLRSLSAFPEVILFDTGSTDGTLEIARGFDNVKVEQGEFIGFGPTKNRAARLARNDWILSIDADEVLTGDLALEILSLDFDSDCVYRFARRSHYNGKFIRGCGWYPDRILRVYNRTRTGFNDNLVHESLEVKDGMRVRDLEAELLHYPYDSAASMVDKLQNYSSLFAEQNRGIKKSSPTKAVLHGAAAFVKGYFLRRGFMDGYEGFLITLCQGLATYFKYIKLYEANRSGTPRR